MALDVLDGSRVIMRKISDFGNDEVVIWRIHSPLRITRVAVSSENWRCTDRRRRRRRPSLILIERHRTDNVTDARGGGT